jgi:hypothetical protein
LRRFTLSTRQLITLAGAGLVGLAAVALFASPASAHTAKLTHHVVCSADGATATVTWTITNDFTTDATLTKVDAAPVLTKIINGAVVAKNNGTLVESVKVPAAGAASLSFTATWSDRFMFPASDTVKQTETGCTPQCPSVAAITRGGGYGGGHSPSPSPTCPSSPSPSPTPSPTRSATPTPTPTPSPTAPPSESSPTPTPSASSGAGSPSPTPSRSPVSGALPVTGAQTGLLAGGALMLLGGGTALFVASRRRRVKFEV